MSVYEQEKRARAQGFYFGVVQVLPRWEQFGHIMHSTLEEAIEDGDADVRDGRARGYEVYRNTMGAHPTSERVK